MDKKQIERLNELVLKEKDFTSRIDRYSKIIEVNKELITRLGRKSVNILFPKIFRLNYSRKVFVLENENAVNDKAVRNMEANRSFCHQELDTFKKLITGELMKHHFLLYMFSINEFMYSRDFEKEELAIHDIWKDYRQNKSRIGEFERLQIFGTLTNYLEKYSNKHSDIFKTTEFTDLTARQVEEIIWNSIN